MRHRLLGKTGLEVSEVGFGCIPIIRLSMDEAIRVLRRAQERGITLFDTANVYLDSEEKIGRAFQGLRPHVVLATKSIKRDRLGLEGDLEAALRAREAGKIRHLGITSHNLEMARKLVATGLFSTIQFPFNFIETAAATQLHPLARERNLGLLAMKPF